VRRVHVQHAHLDHLADLRPRGRRGRGRQRSGLVPACWLCRLAGEWSLLSSLPVAGGAQRWRAADGCRGRSGRWGVGGGGSVARCAPGARLSGSTNTLQELSARRSSLW
jgi:hypothetical protein